LYYSVRVRAWNRAAESFYGHPEMAFDEMIVLNLIEREKDSI
jgi:hypothetical protein